MRLLTLLALAGGAAAQNPPAFPESLTMRVESTQQILDGYASAHIDEPRTISYDSQGSMLVSYSSENELGKRVALRFLAERPGDAVFFHVAPDDTCYFLDNATYAAQQALGNVQMFFTVDESTGVRPRTDSGDSLSFDVIQSDDKDLVEYQLNGQGSDSIGKHEYIGMEECKVKCETESIKDSMDYLGCRSLSVFADQKGLPQKMVELSCTYGAYMQEYSITTTTFSDFSEVPENEDMFDPPPDWGAVCKNQDATVKSADGPHPAVYVTKGSCDYWSFSLSAPPNVLQGGETVTVGFEDCAPSSSFCAHPDGCANPEPDNLQFDLTNWDIPQTVAFIYGGAAGENRWCLKVSGGGYTRSMGNRDMYVGASACEAGQVGEKCCYPFDTEAECEQLRAAQENIDAIATCEDGELQPPEPADPSSHERTVTWYGTALVPVEYPVMVTPFGIDEPSECQPVNCRMYCEHGWAKNDQGCDVCMCAEPPISSEAEASSCQPVRCRMACPNGWAKDRDGCDICKCALLEASPVAEVASGPEEDVKSERGEDARTEAEATSDPDPEPEAEPEAEPEVQQVNPQKEPDAQVDPMGPKAQQAEQPVHVYEAESGACTRPVAVFTAACAVFAAVFLPGLY